MTTSTARRTPGPLASLRRSTRRSPGRSPGPAAGRSADRPSADGPSAGPAPASNVRPSRLDGLDLARGLAVLGMVVAHLGPPHPDFDWARPDTWVAVVDGRSAVLFALCAGVSLTLMTRPRPASDPSDPSDPSAPEGLVVHRRRVLVRAVALFVLGSLLTVLDTPVQVILPTYAVCFVATIPLLRARTRTAAGVAAAALVTGPVCTAVGRSVLHDASDPLVHGVLLGAYPGITWWGVVLVGLVVGRLPLRRTRVHLLLLAAGIAAGVVGYGGGVLVRAALGLPPGDTSASGSASTGPGTAGAGSAGAGSAGTSPADPGPHLVPQGGGTVEHPGVDWAGLTSVQPHAGSTPELLGALGVALAVLALSLLTARRAGVLLAPVRAVGALALTVYAAHIVVYAALDATGDGHWHTGWTATLLVVVGAGLVATPWRRWIGTGPLERLVRRTSRSLDGPGPRSRPH
ncbi:hypothetical protein DEI84_09925 [Curtobacterium sp. MCBD17_023]|nr:hypothetical protein DEI84_09925 [Curtobacterium sp. MCBD17_023]